MTIPQIECLTELQSEQTVTVMTPLTPAQANLIRALGRLRKQRAKRVLIEFGENEITLFVLGKPEKLGRG